MRIEHAQAGMVLARDIIDDRGNLLLEKGISLTEAYISRLRHLGIRLLQVVDSNAASLKKAPVISPDLRNELTLCFRTLFTMKAQDILNQKLRAAYFTHLETTMEDVISQTEVHCADMLNVQLRDATPDEVNHAVNVCLLAIVTGLYVKLPRPVLRSLALGALLHDLGKTLVVANTPGRTAEQTRYLHSSYGRELLLQSKINPTVARIAAEHHEAFDGTGFPCGLKGKEIHPLSRLVAIANDYDHALSATMLNGTSRQAVIEQMMNAGGKLYDMNILRAFFHTTALYPPGSLVQLNTGQRAYVVKSHSHSPLRPLVRILQTADPVDIDLLFKPYIYISEIIEE